MNYIQHERAVQLIDQLVEEIKNLVNERLKSEDTEVEDLVRTLLSENMRFWK